MSKDRKLAESFELAACEDHDCGLHILARDRAGNVLEIVMSREQTQMLIDTAREILTLKTN